MILSRTRRRLFLTTLVMSFICIGQAHGQAGSPGMKQMQDAQRKAEHKARTSKQPQHHHASQHKETGSALPASSP